MSVWEVLLVLLGACAGLAFLGIFAAALVIAVQRDKDKRRGGDR